MASFRVSLLDCVFSVCRLSYNTTHAHTCTHTCTHTHMHHTYTHAHTHTHMRTRTHAHSHTQANASVQVDASDPYGILITNGEFTAFVDPRFGTQVHYLVPCIYVQSGIHTYVALPACTCSDQVGQLTLTAPTHARLSA